jgi:hypothetical protein
MKTAGRETQTTGSHCPATEHMTRKSRTDLARSSGLRSKKNSSREEMYFFLTSPFIELLRLYSETLGFSRITPVVLARP